MDKLKYFTIKCLIILMGCYPTFNVSNLSKENLMEENKISAPSKVQLYNDNIYLFPKGFISTGDSIIGDCNLYKVDGTRERLLTKKQIPIDSIAAIVNYIDNTGAARYVGSILLGMTSPILTFFGIYCAACPKCCFGSCPTIYNDDQILEAELFSQAISQRLETDDLDLLQFKPANDFSIKITNEAMETHYINKFNMFSAAHPAGTKIYPDEQDSLLLIQTETSFQNAINRENGEISDVLRNDDYVYYRSGLDKVKELKNGLFFDHIDISASTPPGLKKAKMIIKYRNTLLSTILLYDVVLASQGVNAVEWTDRMNNDDVFASQFKFIYETFSGINIKSLFNDNWQSIAKIKDAGPLNWKYAAIEIPIEDDNVKVRLEFFPDNFMIDYVAFDFSSNIVDQIIVTELHPYSILNEKGEIVEEVYSYIQIADSNYLVTNPGDNYKLNYSKPVKKENEELTLMIRSRGFYNEWIRGSWLKEKNSGYSFDIFDISGTVSYLAQSWIENKDLIEKEFFNSRIPLRR
jgi:hypothetical protein